MVCSIHAQDRAAHFLIPVSHMPAKPFHDLRVTVRQVGALPGSWTDRTGEPDPEPRGQNRAFRSAPASNPFPDSQLALILPEQLLMRRRLAHQRHLLQALPSSATP